VRFRVWNTSSFVIMTAAYSIQPYFVPRLSSFFGSRFFLAALT
jgi:hypothetical protein